MSPKKTGVALPRSSTISRLAAVPRCCSVFGSSTRTRWVPRLGNLHRPSLNNICGEDFCIGGRELSQGPLGKTKRSLYVFNGSF